MKYCSKCGYEMLDDAVVCPKCGNRNADHQHYRIMSENYDEGSFGGGFALGFLLGIIGVIVAIAINKPATRKGAANGLLVQIGIAVVIYVCGVASLFRQAFIFW